MLLVRFVVIGLFLRHECASHILEWFGCGSSPQFSNFGTPLLEIPFEELGPEDKFLVEANKITGLKLSQLDFCQHKIVMKIKASCGTLSDEELAKLSVNLLNCQAVVEGRRIYPCNEDMNLKTCTKDMDPETWNAYHIMSNRARAVCYAARQEQFRALAEMTINRLVASSKTHIEQMSAMQVKNVKLEKATQLALDKISHSQHDVTASYSRLRRLESGLQNQLEEDKTGLEAMGTLVTQEAESIDYILKDLKKSIDDRSQELVSHKKEEFIEHDKLMEGLKGSLKTIELINNKLGKIESLMERSATQYSSQSSFVITDLKSVSKSLSEILASTTTLQKLAEEKMSLVSNFLGEKGENLDLAVHILIHLIFLLVAMVLCSFLELSIRLKALVVIAGMANAYCSLMNLPYFLTYLELYSSLASAVIVDTIVVKIVKIINSKKNNSHEISTRIEINKSNIPEREHNGFKKPQSKVDEWLTEKFSDRETLPLKNGFLETPLSKDTLFNQDDQVSLASGRSLRNRIVNTSPTDSLAGSSTSGRKTACLAIRPNGQRCKMGAKSGQLFCRIHENIR